MNDYIIVKYKRKCQGEKREGGKGGIREKPYAYKTVLWKTNKQTKHIKIIFSSNHREADGGQELAYKILYVFLALYFKKH